jgi:RNA polymerase sigma-70 factor (sigma-E family)
MNGVAEAVGRSAIGIFEPSRARLERLGEWFAAEHEPLLRLAYLLTGDRAAAEDLVQEAFVRIYRAGGRAEAEGFRTYARRTLVNLGRSAWRRRQREERALETSREHGVDPGPATDHGARDEIWTALRALSRRQRAVVALRFYEDMTEAQIADMLGTSVGAIKKHLSRAMEKLRVSLGREREP